jgi:uncharacterized protein
MKTMINRVVAAGLTVSVLMLASAMASGAANPASVYCDQVGGQGIPIDSGGFGGDQAGFCRLSDGSLMEEWTLFRAKDQASLAATNFLQAEWHEMHGDIATWANQNCEQLGGKVETWTEHIRPSLKYSICQFNDKSAVEIWTLYAGPSYYPKLAKLLRSAP